MARTGFIQNELDLKLLVLYIMSRTAAPVTFNQLLDVALCDAGVDYFSLTEVVGHLVETGHLEQTGQVYAITEKGRRNSEICESSLPYSVRMHCDENLGKLNGALKRAAQVQTGGAPSGRHLHRAPVFCRRRRPADGAEVPLSLPGEGTGPGGALPGDARGFLP